MLISHPCVHDTPSEGNLPHRTSQPVWRDLRALIPKWSYYGQEGEPNYFILHAMFPPPSQPYWDEPSSHCLGWGPSLDAFIPPPILARLVHYQDHKFVCPPGLV